MTELYEENRVLCARSHPSSYGCPWIKVGRVAVGYACYLISHKILDVDRSVIFRFMSSQRSLTAAHCAKSLVISSSSGTPILRQYARLLILVLIELIAKMVPLIHDKYIGGSSLDWVLYPL